MPRPKSDIPSYRKHSSGQARTTINGRDYLLGPHGTQASKREYDRLIAEYLASGRSPCFGIVDDLAMAELMLAYLEHAKRYYGTGLSSEWHRIKLALRPVTALYPKYPAVQFGPQEFKAVRQRMVVSGLTRTGINAHMKRVVRMFKWAAADGMLAAAVHETLRLIPGLRRGRSEATESQPVKPVTREVIEATLKHLTPVVADMVRTQLYSGCRPGEVDVASLILDEGLQAREEINQQIVSEYAQEIREGGWRHGSIRVVMSYVVDGFHRVRAVKEVLGDPDVPAETKASLRRIPAERVVVDPSVGNVRKIALREAVGANQNHGLRRSNRDKRRAAELALEAWPSLSNRRIARLTGISHSLVNDVRGTQVSGVEESSTLRILTGRGDWVTVDPSSSNTVTQRRKEDLPTGCPQSSRTRSSSIHSRDICSSL